MLIVKKPLISGANNFHSIRVRYLGKDKQGLC